MTSEAAPAELALTLEGIKASLPWLGTELGLAALLLLLLSADLIWGRRPKVVSWLTVLGLCVVTVLWIFQTTGLESYSSIGRPWALMGGALELDAWSQWFKGLMLAAATATALLLVHNPPSEVRQGELNVLLLAMTLAAVLLAGANHLLVVYIALALISLSAYAWTGLSAGLPPAPSAAEAAIKYMIYGAASSALMLFGISLIYGLTGTLQLGSGLALRLADADPVVATVGLLMVLAGLTYKLSAAPFHFWAPDVYEASPGALVLALSTLSKLSALAVLLRLTESVATVPSWPLAVGGLALLTLTVGSLGALTQLDFKRMMAYAGAAQAGYLMMGLCTSGEQAERAVMVYALVYALLTGAAFIFGTLLAARLKVNNNGISAQAWHLDSWQGLGRQYPLLGAGMAVALAGLVGLPPTVGFVGKLAIFLPLVESVQREGLFSLGGALALALLAAGLLYTVVSLFFYLRVPLRLFMEPISPESTHTARTLHWSERLAVWGMCLIIIYLGTLGVTWLLH